MTEPIYRRPSDYDLEHEGETEDIAFYVALCERVRPARVLELACGTGRVTVPLAQAGARSGYAVVGLERAAEMLSEAERRRASEPPRVRRRLTLVEGDMRTWRSDTVFDLIVSPCSSMCHLLSLDDQLAAWRTARENLAPGGRLVVDVSMPNLAAYTDSYHVPPRLLVEVDRDTADPETGERLIRYRTTRYLAHQQRAQVRYLYDKFARAAPTERFFSDYDSHVYFPRELELLYLHAGFAVEAVVGDYRGRPIGPASPRLIMTGLKA